MESAEEIAREIIEKEKDEERYSEEMGWMTFKNDRQEVILAKAVIEQAEALREIHKIIKLRGGFMNEGLFKWSTKYVSLIEEGE